MLCSDDHLIVIAIAANAHTQDCGLEGFTRSLIELECLAMQQEAATGNGDDAAAYRFKLNRRDLTDVRALFEENRRSFSTRYPKEEVSPDAPSITAADHLRLRKHLTDPLTVLKLAHGYAYQGDESPGWKTSKARELCDAAKGNAAACLEGYESRPWGLYPSRTRDL